MSQPLPHIGTRRGMLAPVARWTQLQPGIRSETLLVLASLYFSLFSNGAFWHAAITSPASQWRLALALFVVITGLQAFLLGLFVHRAYARPLLSVLILVTALTSHFMSAYGIYLDPDMIRNVLHTDRRESAELVTWGLLVPVFIAAVPITLLWRVRIVSMPWPRALLRRAVFLLATLLITAGGALLAFQPIASMMRNQHQVRYLVAPANYLVSLTSVLTSSPPGPAKPRQPIGLDAKQMPAATGRKPRLLVLVVGETARAANWGLNGYARNTTPELGAMPEVINFRDVSSCGSATEVSLPCMFSPIGRYDYDEKSIRGQQSLLHVLDRAGIRTLWRDNQSGCKGVCDGLPSQSLADATDPKLCNGSRCLDEILIKDLDAQLQPASGDRVIVLHQLGNHGPSYYERYPEAFRRFTPACESSDLGQCDPQSIVNAYDNALAYTDHFLSRTIHTLAAVDDYDTALIYVSDHGESLGENGLFLHGIPYAIAPKEQTHVPMIMWLSSGFSAGTGIDTRCLAQRAARPASHDDLFSSVLDLMDVKTSLYDRQRDLFAGCRTPRG